MVFPTTNRRVKNQTLGIGVPKNRGYKPLPQEIHPLKNRG